MLEESEKAYRVSLVCRRMCIGIPIKIKRPIAGTVVRATIGIGPILNISGALA
jgi:hypothetical protein